MERYDKIELITMIIFVLIWSFFVLTAPRVHAGDLKVYPTIVRCGGECPTGYVCSPFCIIERASLHLCQELNKRIKEINEALLKDDKSQSKGTWHDWGRDLLLGRHNGLIEAHSIMGCDEK